VEHYLKLLINYHVHKLKQTLSEIHRKGFQRAIGTLIRYAHPLTVFVETVKTGSQDVVKPLPPLKNLKQSMKTFKESVLWKVINCFRVLVAHSTFSAHTAYAHMATCNLLNIAHLFGINLSIRKGLENNKYPDLDEIYYSQSPFISRDRHNIKDHDRHKLRAELDNHQGHPTEDNSKLYNHLFDLLGKLMNRYIVVPHSQFEKWEGRDATEKKRKLDKISSNEDGSKRKKIR
jgi:hypothetical protein